MATPGWGAQGGDYAGAGYGANQWQQGAQGQQWQGYGSSWGAGAQQYAAQQPPPPPSAPGDASQPPPPPPPADPASAYASNTAGWAGYGQGYGQWSQYHQQYAGHPGYSQQQQWEWSQHQQGYAAGGAQAGGWQQQPGYNYHQQSHAASWQPSGPAAPALPSGPPPAAPAPPPQPGATPAAAPPLAAADSGAAASQHAQHYHGCYVAVPPPPSLTQPSVTAGRRAFSIRPQLPKVKPPVSSNPLVAAFNQAASKITSTPPEQPPLPAPAYTRVQVGAPAAASQQQQQQQAMNPQQWPPALKEYVERAFKSCDARQRGKLQEVLKKVIGDAQSSGELWTRDWQTMPLPDLSQTAADAAAVLAEVAAVAGPAAAPAGAQPQYAARTWPNGASSAAAPQRYQHQQQQQQQQYQQQYQQQQASFGSRAQRQRLEGQGGRKGAKGRKRRFRSYSSESNSSDSEQDQWSYTERQRRKRRAGRFADDGSGRAGNGSAWGAADRRQQLAALEEGEDEEVDWDSMAIKGTSQALEKSYFRLTSAPDPATVRPEAVLRRALDRLVGLLRGKKVNYFYALDQFKGMRQDCTVQHIRNELAVQVYEAHARAALEYGDDSEFNQCQAQLRVLYNEGIPGCKAELLAYRILWQGIHAGHGEILQLLNTLKKLTREEAALPNVAHALAVRAALAQGDFARFFRLYESAPALGRALMDIAVPKLRFEALKVVCKAFLPTVPLPFLAVLLGFARPHKHVGKPSAETSDAAEAGKQVGEQSDGAAAEGAGGAASRQGAPGEGVDAAADGAAKLPLPGCMEAEFLGEHAAEADLAEGCLRCIEWLGECGAVLKDAESPTGALLDCKASAPQLQMPSQKAKVAHADENLRVDDFLKSEFAQLAA